MKKAYLVLSAIMAAAATAYFIYDCLRDPAEEEAASWRHEYKCSEQARGKRQEESMGITADPARRQGAPEEPNCR